MASYQTQKGEGTPPQIVEAFFRLPSVLQNEKELFDTLHVTSWEEMSSTSSLIDLKKTLSFLQLNDPALHPHIATPLTAEALFEKAQRASELYSQSKELSTPQDQTTIAKALQRAASLFLKEERVDRYKEVIRYSESILSLDPQLEKLLQSSSPHVRFIERGTQEVRKQHIRVEPKTIDEKRVVELSFELTSAAREKLRLKKGNDLYTVSKISSFFEKKIEEGVFSSETGKAIPLGHDLLITSRETPSVSICIGNSPTCANQYRLVRIRFDQTAEPKEIQKLLCRTGLMTALMPTPKEDRNLCLRSQIVACRYPELFYDSSKRKKDASLVYTGLTDKQKKQVETDMHALRWVFTGDRIEAALPSLIDEARTQGARALGIGINAGSLKSTARVFIDILKGGFLSSQERFQRGILGLGNVPTLNNMAGSSDQVFSRILTQNLFDESYSLRAFHNVGPIFILSDIEAFERMPFGYPIDRIGMRNPDFYLPLVPLPGNPQPLAINLWGKTMLQARRNLSELIGNLNKGDHLTNECMFDTSLSGNYVRRVIVQSERARSRVLHILFKNRIHFIHGLPIEEAVVASDRLTPEVALAMSEKNKESEAIYVPITI